MKNNMYYICIVIWGFLSNFSLEASLYLSPIGLNKHRTFIDMSRNEKYFFLEKKFGSWESEKTTSNATVILSELRTKLDRVIIIQEKSRLEEDDKRVKFKRLDLEEMFIIHDKLFEQLRVILTTASDSDYLIEKFVAEVGRLFDKGENIYDFKFQYKKRKNFDNWIDEIDNLLQDYFLLVQWELLNRFPGKESIQLWRGQSRNIDNFSETKINEVFFQANFFSYLASYVMDFYEYWIIANVPFVSIRQLFWFSEAPEPEMIVFGPAEVIKVFNSHDLNESKAAKLLAFDHDKKSLKLHVDTMPNLAIIKRALEANLGLSKNQTDLLVSA